MTGIKVTDETDCLRFIVALCAARDDEQLVKRVIETDGTETP
ncbi:hypothetical protein Acsp04_04990 [Actinomadura sp. NBRC 104425]|nr:hypothetical protein [Actinomadura sp. NBRC 104425]GLZ10264.1 hypothetical protein Acsp04_04990 [Actinomadura sp. NBRC 104425]